MNTKKDGTAKAKVLFCVCLFFASGLLAAQDGFGFGFDAADESAAIGGGAAGGNSASVRISGEVLSEAVIFPDGFSSAAKAGRSELGNLFLGKLNFEASAFNAEAVIHLNLRPVFGNDNSPIALDPNVFDEAYLRLYFGRFSVETGIRKLTWGKADSMGPLDVINPLDYSDFTFIDDQMRRKIARPMVHAGFSIGDFSRLEAVFVPWFEGSRFDFNGRWKPSVMGNLEQQLSRLWAHPFSGLFPADFPKTIDDIYFSSDGSLKYAQAGIRFTTTVGSVDLGFQYFYGNLSRPAISVSGTEKLLLGDPSALAVHFDYNRYHQAGVDVAAVLAGFNVRGEFAANITGDLSGNDGTVYNPSLAWSLGFDRDIVAGINVNLQGAQSIRLLDSKVGNTPADTEADADLTQTRITLVLSRKFLRDALELKATTLWNIEGQDALIVPAIVWTKNDVECAASGGIFVGDKDGELGQYRKNSFVKLAVGYWF